MTTWAWVGVFCGIVLGGLIMVACLTAWLWRKATALLAEAEVLLERGGELAGLLAQLEAPDSGALGGVESGLEGVRERSTGSDATSVRAERRRMVRDLRLDLEDQQ